MSNLQLPRIALIGYPMVFQRPGGLANKIRSTTQALIDAGVNAQLFDSNNDKLTDFNVVHVFGTGSGNHRIVQAANDVGVPVVLSPVYSLPYGTWESYRDRLVHMACAKVSRYSLNTTWGHTLAALEGSHRIIVLGDAEAEALSHGFKINKCKVRIVANGISDSFFDAKEDAFRAQWHGDRPILLMSGAISPAKNQLNAVLAVRELDVDLVLFGPLANSQRDYLDSCLEEGRGRVHYLGSRDLSDPFYIAAFAAASVTVLPSRTEVTPNVVLESLAAGTPVVCTERTAWRDAFPRWCFRSVNPESVDEIRANVRELRELLPCRKECRDVVRHMRWSNVAARLMEIYEEVLKD